MSLLSDGWEVQGRDEGGEGGWWITLAFLDEFTIDGMKNQIRMWVEKRERGITLAFLDEFTIDGMKNQTRMWTEKGERGIALAFPFPCADSPLALSPLQKGKD